MNIYSIYYVCNEQKIELTQIIRILYWTWSNVVFLGCWTVTTRIQCEHCNLWTGGDALGLPVAWPPNFQLPLERVVEWNVQHTHTHLDRYIIEREREKERERNAADSHGARLLHRHTNARMTLPCAFDVAGCVDRGQSRAAGAHSRAINAMNNRRAQWELSEHNRAHTHTHANAITQHCR